MKKFLILFLTVVVMAVISCHHASILNLDNEIIFVPDGIEILTEEGVEVKNNE